MLNTFKIPYGNKTIVEEFSKIIQPILKQIDLLEKENQKLSELRDWLLPMLMNGQVKVKDAEDMLAMAAEPKEEYGGKKKK